MHSWRKPIALFLASWTLVISIGFTVSGHWCGGELRSFSLFAEAENCHEAHVVEQPSCHKAAEAMACHQVMDEGDCCQDKTEHVQEFEDDGQMPSYNLIRIFAPLLSIMKQAWKPRFVENMHTPAKCAQPDPPPPIANIPVFVQSFRI